MLIYNEGKYKHINKIKKNKKKFKKKIIVNLALLNVKFFQIIFLCF